MEIKSLVIQIGEAQIELTPEQLKEVNEKLCGKQKENNGQVRRMIVADAYPKMPRGA